MTRNAAYARLIASIDALRRRWSVLRIASSAFLAAAVVGTVVLAAVGADNLVAPGFAGRMLLSNSILLVSLAAGVGLVRSYVDHRRDEHFAMLVEDANPDLNDRLINAVQLGRGTEEGVSPGLIAAIVDDADRATSDIDWGASLDRRSMWRALATAGLVGAIALAYVSFSPDRFGNGLARVARPWADIPPYTATRVLDATVKPGDLRVAEGSTLTFEARVDGVIPSRAGVAQTFDGGERVVVPMLASSSAPDRFSGVVPDVRRSFAFRVVAGDGRSREYRVDVVPRPKVASLAMVAIPPPYAPGPGRPVAGFEGDVASVAGGGARITLAATKPLKSASMVTDRGDALALAGDGKVWSVAFTVWTQAAKGVAPSPHVEAPTSYRLKLVDSDGFENEAPAWHTVTPTPDAPPIVGIASPGRDLAVKPDAAVPIAVEARDDLGLAEVRILYRVNDAPEVHELARFPANANESRNRAEWSLATSGLKAGDVVSYWAEATDRNTITGPGRGESRRYTLALIAPQTAIAKLETLVSDYAQAIEELARLQRENRAQTASDGPAEGLVARQAKIRGGTRLVARAMEKDALPTATIVKALDDLYAGLMAKSLSGLESARDAAVAAKADDARRATLPIQDAIVAELDAILARLQKNEQAKKALRRIAKTDKPAAEAITKQLTTMVKDLDKLLKDETELGGKFERMPKKADNDVKDDAADPKSLEEMRKAWNKWAKGTVAELAKLPTGFVDDFGLRPDVNKIFEEVEKAAGPRPKSEKIEVALEDLGTGLEEQATKMKEDLEMWMPNAPDAAKWVLEEPLNQKGMKIPEMTLPKALEDMVGDLLQEADEFDEEADDKTSAWGANLDQAGWGVGDGPISTFSAKGKTGNDLPNNMELGGRAGDGRRGKSSGQAVGDTSKALAGRKTPARVGNEAYEPGQMKQEKQDDPNGVTGGGKKAGAGRKGLQGGTPPDIAKDMGRLSEKQAGLREKAEQVAKSLDAIGVPGGRLGASIAAMKAAEADLRDLRYVDAARHRKEAMSALRSGLSDLDRTTATRLSRSRDLPPELRKELLQSSEEGFAPGYETLMKDYYKALSAPEK